MTTTTSIGGQRTSLTLSVRGTLSAPDLRPPDHVLNFPLLCHSGTLAANGKGNVEQGPRLLQAPSWKLQSSVHIDANPVSLGYVAEAPTPSTK
jgi:hypothetical protein